MSSPSALNEAHLRSASDTDLARLRRQHQEAEDRAQEVAWAHSEIVTKIMAEQNRRAAGGAS